MYFYTHTHTHTHFFLPHPTLDVVPEGLYGDHFVAERYGEAVDLVASQQGLERIGLVAVVALERTRKVEMRVESHVVVVLERERMAEEEARVVAAHVMIGHEVALEDVRQRVLLHASQLGAVDPARHRPLLGRYEAELDRGGGGGGVVDHCHHGALELVREVHVVDDDVWIAATRVEAQLELGERALQVGEVLVAREYEDAGVEAAIWSSAGVSMMIRAVAAISEMERQKAQREQSENKY